MYSAKILLDSLNPQGNRLTSFELTYPRFVHAELLTHRAFSRNSASSRAIPINKMLARVRDNPVEPIEWGLNQPGMQALVQAAPHVQAAAREAWLSGLARAIQTAEELQALGIHKQIVNRVLEPWMYITVIVSATDYSNWFALRCHPDAQPEIRHLAELMRAAYDKSTPELVRAGEWHLPFVGPDDAFQLVGRGWSTAQISNFLRDVSVARCARVSYLTHDGRNDIYADVKLASKLRTSGHWSPFEHVAVSLDDDDPVQGNFRGWGQYRKFFPEENVAQPQTTLTVAR